MALVGTGFYNNQYFLLAGLQAYYVADNAFEDSVNEDTRDSGVSADLQLPFIDTGYWNAELRATYYEDYKLAEREPASLQLNLSRSEQHGTSWLPNREFSLSGFGVRDRGDNANGGSLHFTQDLPAQMYLELGGKYAESDTDLVQ